MEENINLFRNYSQTYEEKVNEWFATSSKNFDFFEGISGENLSNALGKNFEEFFKGKMLKFFKIPSSSVSLGEKISNKNILEKNFLEDVYLKLKEPNLEDKDLFSEITDLSSSSDSPSKENKPIQKKSGSESAHEFPNVEINLFVNRSIKGHEILNFLRDNAEYSQTLNHNEKDIKNEENYKIIGEICSDFSTQSDKKLLQMMKSYYYFKHLQNLSNQSKGNAVYFLVINSDKRECENFKKIQEDKNKKNITELKSFKGLMLNEHQRRKYNLLKKRIHFYHKFRNLFENEILFLVYLPFPSKTMIKNIIYEAFHHKSEYDKLKFQMDKMEKEFKEKTEFLLSQNQILMSQNQLLMKKLEEMELAKKET